MYGNMENKTAAPKNIMAKIYTIAGFLKEIQNSNNKPDFIKGTITGPFTLSTSLYDHNNKFIYYNEATREIITKLLVFKALWQIKEFKKVSSSCTPIIFMDEPSLSKLNSPLCVDIKKEDIKLDIDVKVNFVKCLLETDYNPPELLHMYSDNPSKVIKNMVKTYRNYFDVGHLDFDAISVAVKRCLLASIQKAINTYEGHPYRSILC